METSEIDDCVLDLIDKYKKLSLGDKDIVCPYHINPKSERANLRVLVGKGNPDEIVLETEIYAKLGGYNLSDMSSEDIRSFMQKRHLGIDCSGYVSHLLDSLVRCKFNKRIWNIVKRNNTLYGSIRYKLRPIENIGVAHLTSEVNSLKISSISEIQPSDMIKLNGVMHDNSLHVVLITRVVRDGNDVLSFEYSNSNKYYGSNNGIRDGLVIVDKPGLGLKDQRWIDNDENGRNWVYDGLMKNYESNGIFRLRYLDTNHG